jgi:hypothetical protein
VLGISLVLGTSASGKTAKSGIPAKVRAELLKVTLDDIAGQLLFTGDMQPVRTTLAKAGHATQPSSRGLPRQTSVYVVALRFDETCPVPEGAAGCNQKHVLELEFPASSPLRILPLREEQQISYPDLRRLGVPVVLAAVPPRR